ncbi:MAG: tRNA (guanosine(37)-N1)-methyltransferase TrmD [Sinobacteraceae bacterium]|nr:tRNA (guanosine(37)-N1)-methyltransferase TrmD [Nevskiaceae bacterium]
MLNVEVLTLFPELVEQVVRHGIPRKAVECGALALRTRNFRDYGAAGDRRVDDRTYGGGPGMVLDAESLARTVAAAKAALGPAAKVIALSPQGARLDQHWVRRLATETALVLVCGRYEGWDERAAGLFDAEVSLGDFVLSGGELAAMAMVDALARLLPGAVGDQASVEYDSFSAGLLDHPHYTRPEVWRGAAVPEVLLSGDHARIARWRLKQALGVTWLKRPDLLADLELSDEQRRLLREYIAETGMDQPGAAAPAKD